MQDGSTTEIEKIACFIVVPIVTLITVFVPIIFKMLHKNINGVGGRVTKCEKSIHDIELKLQSLPEYENRTKKIEEDIGSIRVEMAEKISRIESDIDCLDKKLQELQKYETQINKVEGKVYSIKEEIVVRISRIESEYMAKEHFNIALDFIKEGIKNLEKEIAQLRFCKGLSLKKENSG